MGESHIDPADGEDLDDEPSRADSPVEIETAGVERSAGSLPLDLFAIVMLVGSMAVEIYTVGIFARAQAARSWPTAHGVVTHSELVTRSIDFEADVRYRYEVGGRPFESKVIRMREVTSKYRSEVEPWVAKYPVGAVVEVRYNPDRATESTLVAGADFINYLIIISPVFFRTIMAVYLCTRVAAVLRWMARRCHS